MLSTKSITSQKLKIAKLSESVQNPFQNIAHLMGQKSSNYSKNFERPFLEKLKIGKLIFHSFQSIAQLFGIEMKTALIEWRSAYR